MLPSREMSVFGVVSQRKMATSGSVSIWGDAVTPEMQQICDDMLQNLPTNLHTRKRGVYKPNARLFALLLPTYDEVIEFRKDAEQYNFMLKCITPGTDLNPWKQYNIAWEANDSSTAMLPEEFKKRLYTFGFRSRVPGKETLVKIDRIFAVYREVKLPMPDWYDPKDDIQYGRFLSNYLNDHEKDVEAEHRSMVTHLATTAAANRELLRVEDELSTVIRDHSIVSTKLTNHLLASWDLAIQRARQLENTLSELVVNRANPTKVAEILEGVAQRQSSIASEADSDRKDAESAHKLAEMLHTMFTETLAALENVERDPTKLRMLDVTAVDMATGAEVLEALNRAGTTEIEIPIDRGNLGVNSFLAPVDSVPPPNPGFFSPVLPPQRGLFSTSPSPDQTPISPVLPPDQAPLSVMLPPRRGLFSTTLSPDQTPISPVLPPHPAPAAPDRSLGQLLDLSLINRPGLTPPPLPPRPTVHLPSPPPLPPRDLIPTTQAIEKRRNTTVELHGQLTGFFQGGGLVNLRKAHVEPKQPAVVPAKTLPGAMDSIMARVQKIAASQKPEADSTGSWGDPVTTPSNKAHKPDGWTTPQAEKDKRQNEEHWATFRKKYPIKSTPQPTPLGRPLHQTGTHDVPQTLDRTPFAVPGSIRKFLEGGGLKGVMEMRRRSLFPREEADAEADSDADEGVSPTQCLAASDEIESMCICGKPGKGFCSRCRKKWYCGSNCQHQDWPVHSQQCRP